MKHNPRTCNAFHSACENVRDFEPMTMFPMLPDDDQFSAERMTLTQIDELADGYVKDGMSTCTCEG